MVSGRLVYHHLQPAFVLTLFFSRSPGHAAYRTGDLVLDDHRVQQFPDHILFTLRHYLNGVRPELLVSPECKALFLAMDGVAGLTANGITNAVVPYLRASGIEKGSCHLFGHAMATQMLENGADLRWIQAMLGHRSVESTQIYTQVSIRALQAVHASTHPAEQGENPEPDETAELPDSP